MNPTHERRIALFLDFENLVTNTGITAATFDLKPSLDRLLERGKVIFRRAYCDWSRFHDAKGGLHELGVELIDVPPSTRAGKNAADMRLVIDALELNYARGHIDTFVIASGDSDFCPLAYKLRENDRVVIGLAVKEATSPLFVNACDEFIYLRPPGRAEGKAQKEGSKLTEVGGGTVREGRGRSTGRGRNPATDRDSAKSAPRSAAGAAGAAAKESHPPLPEFVIVSVKRLLAAATQPLNPSFVKEALVRKKPDFDERELGYSTFSKLLAALEKEGLLRREQHGRQWYIVPAEGGPKPVAAPAATTGVARAAKAPAPVEDEEEVIPDPDDD